MEFDKVLKKRRSVRRYKADPVPRESVLKVLEAARIAPSAAHRQPWHFIVVEDSEMRGKLAGRQAWAAEAPVTVVAFADEEASPSWCSNDVGIAFEHLVLAATDLGLGTCWMGLTRRDGEIRELLRTPDNLKVVAMTPLGVPDEEPAPKERKSLDEIVSWETYGKQAEQSTLKRELPKGRRLQPGPAGNVVMATVVGNDGKPNIITLGMYMPISIDPPLVCIGIAPRRYSHTLLEENGEFVINTPSIDLEDEMHYCGINSGKDVDKWAETGLTPIPSLKVQPPRIEECFSHMECKVVQAHTCGDHTLFVGEVLTTTVDEGVMKGESLDVLVARPIVQKNHVYYTVSDK